MRRLLVSRPLFEIEIILATILIELDVGVGVKYVGAHLGDLLEREVIIREYDGPEESRVGLESALVIGVADHTDKE